MIHCEGLSGFNCNQHLPFSCLNTIRLEAIALRLETISLRLEAIASRLEAIASRLEAIAIRLEVIAIRLEDIAIRLEVIAIRNKEKEREEKENTVISRSHPFTEAAMTIIPGLDVIGTSVVTWAPWILREV